MDKEDGLRLLEGSALGRAQRRGRGSERAKFRL